MVSFFRPCPWCLIAISESEHYGRHHQRERGGGGQVSQLLFSKFEFLITFVLQVTESLEESKAERGPGGEVTQQELYF